MRFDRASQACQFFFYTTRLLIDLWITKPITDVLIYTNLKKIPINYALNVAGKPIKITHLTKEGQPIDKLQVSHSSSNPVSKQFRFTIRTAIDTASYITAVI